MVDRILVRSTNRNLYGQKIAGKTGLIYYVNPETGNLHAVDGAMPNPEPGCHPIDADRFRLFSKFRVSGAKKATPPPPPPTPKKKAPVTDVAPIFDDEEGVTPGPNLNEDSGDASGEKATPDPKPQPEASLVSELSDADDAWSKKEWKGWARSKGIALSKGQKALNKRPLIEAIREEARAKDLETASE